MGCSQPKTPKACVLQDAPRSARGACFPPPRERVGTRWHGDTEMSLQKKIPVVGCSSGSPDTTWSCRRESPCVVPALGEEVTQQPSSGPGRDMAARSPALAAQRAPGEEDEEEEGDASSAHPAGNRW